MKGTLATSGSLPSNCRKRVMAVTPSIMPSSMQMSRTFAPFSTCWRATLTASSYLPSLMSFANFGEPATLVRSPIMMKTPACWVKGCDPERRSGFAFVGSATLVFSDSLTFDSLTRDSQSGRRRILQNEPGRHFRGGWPSSAFAIAAMCSGVFPQQPPAILINPPRAKSPR